MSSPSTGSSDLGSEPEILDVLEVHPREDLRGTVIFLHVRSSDLPLYPSLTYPRASVSVRSNGDPQFRAWPGACPE